MSDSSEQSSQNPWTRPGWIVSAGVVLVLVVLGVVLTIVNVRDPESPSTAASTPPAVSPSPTAEPAPSADAGGASLCGLGEVVLEGTVDEAPPAEWAYEGTVPYPTSRNHGPGAVDEAGFRSCFEHSPRGALFMAANAAAISRDPAVALAWGEYAIAPGPFHDQLLSGESSTADSDGTRMELQGFRLLSYTGSTARVDLGVSVTRQGQQSYGSFVYELVWFDGDWRISADVETPLDVAGIPSLAGYVPWAP